MRKTESGLQKVSIALCTYNKETLFKGTIRKYSKSGL